MACRVQPTRASVLQGTLEQYSKVLALQATVLQKTIRKLEQQIQATVKQIERKEDELMQLEVRFRDQREYCQQMLQRAKVRFSPGASCVRFAQPTSAPGKAPLYSVAEADEEEEEEEQVPEEIIDERRVNELAREALEELAALRDHCRATPGLESR